MRDPSLYHPNVTLTSLDAAYVIITNLTCFSSIMGCLVTVGLFLMYPDIRTTARKLLVCLSIANFIQCIGGILQASTYYKTLLFPDERQFLCESAASTSVIGQVASALWTCALAVFLFLTVSLRATGMANKMVYVFYGFCFGLPLLVAIQAGASDVYGYDIRDILYFGHPSVCWISDRVANRVQWCLVTVQGWVIAAYFICLILFFVINCSIFCQSQKSKGLSAAADSTEDVAEDMAVLSAARQLRSVPFFYCLLHVWGTGYFLFTEYPTKRHLRAFDWLLVIKAFGDNLQGLVNCILFCVTTPKISRMVARQASRWCACCCSWCQRQQHRLMDDRWIPQPIVRMRRSLVQGSKRRSLDGSDVNISGISLELPTTEEEDGEEYDSRFTEDEVLFER